MAGSAGFTAVGTLTTTIGGVAYTQPANGTRGDGTEGRHKLAAPARTGSGNDAGMRTSGVDDDHELEGVSVNVLDVMSHGRLHRAGGRALGKLSARDRLDSDHGHLRSVAGPLSP